MGISDYVRRLREKVGNDFLLMPSVAAFIVDHAGKVLLVRHVDGRWMLPGGALEPGERPAEAMRRECLEEAGIVVEPIRIAGVYSGPEYQTTYTNGDVAGWMVAVFEATIVSGEPRASDDETQDVGWFAPAEIEGLEQAGGTVAMLRALLRGEPYV